jgi:hypothetical protein
LAVEEALFEGICCTAINGDFIDFYRPVNKNSLIFDRRFHAAPKYGTAAGSG